MNEEEIKNLVKEYMEDYFRMSRPGFEIVSNASTEAHGKSEFCLTTDKGQGLHFYQQGNCKLGANKSIEIRSGIDSKENEFAVVISANNGDIKIEAVGGDLILEGNNVQVRATAPDGEVSLYSNKVISTQSPELQVESTKLRTRSTSDTLIAGGTVSLYSETGSVTTGSGQDAIVATSFWETIINVADQARTLLGIK